MGQSDVIADYENDHAKLASTIMNCFPDYPGNNGETEGAIECAIRIIMDSEKKLRKVDFSKVVADFYKTHPKPSLGAKQTQLIDAMAKMLGSFHSTGSELEKKKQQMAGLMVTIIVDVATMAAILDVDLSEAWEYMQKAMESDDCQKNG